jgi:hypothetical protein
MDHRDFPGTLVFPATASMFVWREHIDMLSGFEILARFNRRKTR